MGKPRKTAKRQASKPAPGVAAKRATPRGTDGVSRDSASASFLGWIYEKRPVAGFVLLFVVLIAIFYAITFIPYVNQNLFPAYMRFNARVSVGVINLFGEGARASGTAVSSNRFSVDIRHGCDAVRFSVDIRHGCDAVAPSALFIAAVLAFPGTLRSKFPGILVGTFVLAAINIVRIVSLFYTGIFYPRAFEAMHVDVWQPVFILLALAFWVIWAWWAARPGTATHHVATETT